jgi:hypothetical protein
MSGPVAESKRIAGKVEGLRKKYQQGIPLAGTAVDKHLARYYEEDPRDDYYEAKADVTRRVKIGENSIPGKLGTEVPVTDRDIDYLLDQRTKEEKYNFDEWKYRLYNPGSDPVKLKYFEKIDPSFFKDREKEIDHDLDLTGRLAKLSLNGVQNEEDVILIYGMGMGKVRPPNWKSHFPYEWTVEETTPHASVKQGFWNPRRFSTQYGAAYYPEMYSGNPLNTTDAYAFTRFKSGVGTPGAPGTFSKFLDFLSGTSA